MRPRTGQKANRCEIQWVATKDLDNRYHFFLQSYAAKQLLDFIQADICSALHVYHAMADPA